MATKVIKLQNSSYTLLPVTDANLVQMTVDNETKSVYDVILEDEEVTAAAFNNLDSRLETVEEDYVTKTYAANTYLTKAVAETTYLKKSALSAAGYITSYLAWGKLVAGADSTSIGGGTANTSNALVNGNHDTLTVSPGNRWITTGVTDGTNSDTLSINHALIDTSKGVAKTSTNAQGVATAATTTTQLTHNSSMVITGVSYEADAAGHITKLSYSIAKLPTDNNDKVKVYGLSDNKAHSLLFKYEGGANASTSGDTANYVGSDSDGITNAYYNPSTNTLYASYIIGSYITSSHVRSLLREDENVITTPTYLVNNEIVIGVSSYKGKTSGVTIATTLTNTSNAQVPTSKAVNDYIAGRSYLNQTDFNTFKGTVESTYLKKTDFNTFKGTVETTYLKKSAAFWGSLGVQTTASYITEPEFKTVKINGSTTNAASTKNCVLQYDTTNECLNFVFN